MDLRAVGPGPKSIRTDKAAAVPKNEMQVVKETTSSDQAHQRYPQLFPLNISVSPLEK